jgi:hypothetical protein
MSSRNENCLRCTQCGFEVYSNDMERSCAKCSKPMTYMGKRKIEKIKKRNRF